MSEWRTDYTADEKVAAYVLTKYRLDGRNAHLRGCRNVKVEYVVGSDGTYGCDTGCEYVSFEANLSCPHDETENGYEWGTFGEMSYLLEAIHTGQPAWML